MKGSKLVTWLHKHLSCCSLQYNFFNVFRNRTDSQMSMIRLGVTDLIKTICWHWFCKLIGGVFLFFSQRLASLMRVYNGFSLYNSLFLRDFCSLLKWFLQIPEVRNSWQRSSQYNFCSNYCSVPIDVLWRIWLGGVTLAFCFSWVLSVIVLF